MEDEKKWKEQQEELQFLREQVNAREHELKRYREEAQRKEDEEKAQREREKAQLERLENERRLQEIERRRILREQREEEERKEQQLEEEKRQAEQRAFNQSRAKLKVFSTVGSDRKKNVTYALAAAVLLYAACAVLGVVTLIAVLMKTGSFFDLAAPRPNPAAFYVIIIGLIASALAATFFLLLWLMRVARFKRIFKSSEKCVARLQKIDEIPKGKKVRLGATYAAIINGAAKVRSAACFPASEKYARKLEKAKYFTVWYSARYGDAVYMNAKHAFKNVETQGRDILDALMDEEKAEKEPD